MEIKNISPLGAVEIPGVGVVEAGATFDATGPLAESLLRQDASFTRAHKQRKGDDQ